MYFAINLAADAQGYEVAKRLRDDAESDLRQSTIVLSNSVAQPTGSFLLIRSGHDFCAIRFTKFHLGDDKQPGTTFHSGDASEFAEYDWYHQGNGTSDLSAAGAKSGHGKLARNPSFGVGRLAFSNSVTKVMCGSSALRWGYPYIVNFSFSTKPGDYGIEIAPTGWTKIEQVKPSDARIRWYKFEKGREPIVLPWRARD